MNARGDQSSTYRQLDLLHVSSCSCRESHLATILTTSFLGGSDSPPPTTQHRDAKSLMLVLLYLCQMHRQMNPADYPCTCAHDHAECSTSTSSKAIFMYYIPAKRIRWVFTAYEAPRHLSEPPYFYTGIRHNMYTDPTRAYYLRGVHRLFNDAGWWHGVYSGSRHRRAKFAQAQSKGAIHAIRPGPPASPVWDATTSRVVPL